MKYYFLVTGPNKKNKIIEAFDKEHAIQIAVKQDGFKHSNCKYSATKTKL